MKTDVMLTDEVDTIKTTDVKMMTEIEEDEMMGEIEEGIVQFKSDLNLHLKFC